MSRDIVEFAAVVVKCTTLPFGLVKYFHLHICQSVSHLTFSDTYTPVLLLLPILLCLFSVHSLVSCVLRTVVTMLVY